MRGGWGPGGRVAGGWSPGLQGRVVNRVLLGYAHEEYRFDLPDELTVEFPDIESPARQFSYPFVAFQRLEDDFDTRFNVDRAKTLESYELTEKLAADNKARVVRQHVPEDFEMPPEGLHIRWPDTPLEQEERLHRYKVYAALAFARANKLDRMVVGDGNRRFGIITAGKTYNDLRQCFLELGLDDAALRLQRPGRHVEDREDHDQQEGGAARGVLHRRRGEMVEIDPRARQAPRPFHRNQPRPGEQRAGAFVLGRQLADVIHIRREVAGVDETPAATRSSPGRGCALGDSPRAAYALRVQPRPDWARV